MEDGKSLGLLFILVAALTVLAGLSVYWVTQNGMSFPSGSV